MQNDFIKHIVATIPFIHRKGNHFLSQAFRGKNHNDIIIMHSSR